MLASAQNEIESHAQLTWGQSPTLHTQAQV